MSANIKNTRKIGDDFELKIYQYFCREIQEGRFIVDQKNCKIFRQKGYYSKDRNGKIIFDISIEMYFPGATDFFQVILIECKNYEKSVSIDNAEEFFEKVNQVAAANGKAVLASTARFQKSVYNYAKSKGISLFRYFDDCATNWELFRSSLDANKAIYAENEENIQLGIYDADFDSPQYNFYFQSPYRLTNSFRFFLCDIIFDSGWPDDELMRVLKNIPDNRPKVPFLNKENLEKRSIRILEKINYNGGRVDLDAICDLENKCAGLTVEKNVSLFVDTNITLPLGKITFNSLRIEIYLQDDVNIGRDRFTLAHELSHYLLAHGKYIEQDCFYDADVELNSDVLMCMSDIDRMEFQANYLASCVLMPREYFVKEFQKILNVYGLSYRGYDMLYVDKQPSNIRSFNIVLSHLMSYFGVSKTAAKVRLQSLGLLVDNL